jgi:hypothetical protein
MGINPNSGRFAGMDQRFSINLAAMRAGTRNQARVDARQRNFGNSVNLAQMGLNGANSGGNLLNNASYSLMNVSRGQQGLAQTWMDEAARQNMEDGYTFNMMRNRGQTGQGVNSIQNSDRQFQNNMASAQDEKYNSMGWNV